MAIGSHRRYCLLKRIVSKQVGDVDLAGVWRAKQEATAGTPLPAGFPHKDALSSVGYVAEEDLAGATVEELTAYVGLQAKEAQAVIAAHAAL